MQSTYDVLIMLQPKTPAIVAKLDEAIKGAAQRLSQAEGLVSRQFYRCRETGSYANVIKWRSQQDNDRYRESSADCPIGALVQSGEVDFKFGQVSQVE
jgi:hypothetical protein